MWFIKAVWRGLKLKRGKSNVLITVESLVGKANMLRCFCFETVSKHQNRYLKLLCLISIGLVVLILSFLYNINMEFENSSKHQNRYLKLLCLISIDLVVLILSFLYNINMEFDVSEQLFLWSL